MLNNPEVQLPRTTAKRPRRTPHAQSDAGSDGAALVALVSAAAAGDGSAWQSLVKRFTPALRAAAGGFRLAPADVDDVVQNTWLAAFRHIQRVKEPEAIGSWLLVTARRESLRILQRGVREILTDEPPSPVASDSESPEHATVETERRDALQAAIKRLPGRQRTLLGTLLKAPGSSYDDIARRLDMPVGSIGPTRERALERLRRDHQLADLLRDEPAV